MVLSDEEAIRRAIAAIRQSDPLIKLLQQVRLGRMQPDDKGLRAVTDSWLETYRNVLSKERFSRQNVGRLDPMPRLTLLVEAGVMPSTHPSLAAVSAAYEQAVTNARE